MLACTAAAVWAASSANAAQYKMVACAGSSGVPGYVAATNTTSANNPGGIFEFHNNCGGTGGDPPGEAAYLRLVSGSPSNPAWLTPK